MPRETCPGPATLPLFSTSGPSRTSTTSVLPLAIISRACVGVIRGTAALAASIICLALVAIASSSPGIHGPQMEPRGYISYLAAQANGAGMLFLRAEAAH